jgi:citrate synthase
MPLEGKTAARIKGELMHGEKTATITYNGESYEVPLVHGSEGEVGLDVTSLKADTGLVTYDPGYGNTGSCTSKITFVEGKEGILRHRGYPIEELAANCTFIETAMLLIFGELPTQTEFDEFRDLLSEHQLLHEDLLHHFEGFPPHGDPMAILSAVMNAMGSYNRELYEIRADDDFHQAVATILSKVRTIAAFSYRKSVGRPFMYPNPELGYVVNFLHMMFSNPFQIHQPSPEATRALSLFLIVHADHEQNCSTSTVRMVGSTQANLFASISSGVCALWGRLHGGANSAVIRQLEEIRDGEMSVAQCIEQVKQKKFRLMGFGHRIYRNFDPRAIILKKAAEDLLESLGKKDELIDIAQELADAALNDDYFIERKLYPNVDFYSGIILRALDIPVPMFPVMFAIGRMPGWIAHWYEDFTRGVTRIHRPRQIYTGHTQRAYVPIEDR